MQLLGTLTDDALLRDVDASIAYLHGQSEIAAGPLGAVGFCMGGRLAFLTAGTRRVPPRPAQQSGCPGTVPLLGLSRLAWH